MLANSAAPIAGRRGRQSPWFSSVRQLWAYRGLTAHLTQRELKVKYKRSVLGWLWSLLNPAMSLLIYTVVFGSFLRVQAPVAGDGETRLFGLYLFCGLVMWWFFSQSINGAMSSLSSAGGLLQKVAFPPACPPIASMLSTLTQTCIETLILVTILIAVGNVSPVFLLFPFLVVLLVLFTMGIALVLSLLNAQYRDVGYLVGIALQLGFFASAIIYPFTRVPEHVGPIPTQDLVRLNPMTQFVGAARDVLYDLQVPSAGRLIGLVVVSVVSLVGGWLIFAWKSADISEELLQ